jgi:hypothetical protein
MLPSFMTKFESMYGISTSADRETLDEVVEQLDKILFDDFIKRKAERLLDITQKGLIENGTAWAEGPKPTGKLRLDLILSGAKADSYLYSFTPLSSERYAIPGSCSFTSQRDYTWSCREGSSSALVRAWHDPARMLEANPETGDGWNVAST